MYCDNQVPAGITADKKGCNTMVSFTESGKKSKCTFLSYSYRKSVEDFYYATDSSQVYCVCIVKAGSTSDAKDIKKEFDSIKKEKKSDSYLKKDEKKLVKDARCGRSGSYVWYICLGSKSDNKKAEKALKKAL